MLEPARALELVQAVQAEFGGDELLQHLEVVNFNGRAGFASLALLWPHGEDAAARGSRLKAPHLRTLRLPPFAGVLEWAASHHSMRRRSWRGTKRTECLSLTRTRMCWRTVA